MLTATATYTLCDILSSIGNFQYDVEAVPLGTVRRSIQGEANDEASQAEIGVIEKKMDDPLCSTVSECEFVAEWELLIAQLQRKRVRIEKLANFMDEEGDSIRIYHPYSHQLTPILIDKLTRRMTIAKVEEDNSQGLFIDEIEGWVIS